MAESRWIAFELHDGLMQWVMGARMHIAALVASMKQAPGGAGTPEELETRLTQILSYLNQASEEGRQLIRFVEGLPSSDGSVDVVQTLARTAELLGRKTREGRPVITFLPPTRPWPALPPQFAWMIVRIVQQAAMNAVRHSDARRVTLILDRIGDRELSVEVDDDGKGFDPAVDYPGHYGLRSMRQRAREARVELTIDSQPNGGGTRVKLRIPVPPDVA
mgnify:CR=1 FL=1